MGVRLLYHDGIDPYSNLCLNAATLALKTHLASFHFFSVDILQELFISYQLLHVLCKQTNICTDAPTALMH